MEKQRGKSHEHSDNFTREEIEQLIEIIKQLVSHEVTKVKPGVRMVLTQSYQTGPNQFNIQKSIIMSLTLASNQKAPLQLSLVDALTLQPIVGATFTSETETIDNTAIATVDATGFLVGVTAGSANLTSVATWTYTDAATQLPVTTPLTVITPVSVTAVTTAEGVQMLVSIGTPVAK